MAGPESLPAAFIVDGRGRIAYIGDALTLEGPLKRIVAGDWDLAAARRRWDETRHAESLRQQLRAAPHLGRCRARARPRIPARALPERRRAADSEPRGFVHRGFSPEGGPRASRHRVRGRSRSVSLTRRKAPGMLDALARVQFLRGDVAGAIETEEAAVALSEGGMQEAEKRTLAEFRAAALSGPR